MPTLTMYLVHRNGQYLDENGKPGGKTFPLTSRLEWIDYMGVANYRAQMWGGEVHKFIVDVRRVPSKIRRASRDCVPEEGDVAFGSGWDLKANPHDVWSVEHMRWNSDWWRANADAFESHVHGMAEEMGTAVSNSGIIKAFWGSHIDLDKIVSVSDLNGECGYFDTLFTIVVQLRDKPLHVTGNMLTSEVLGPRWIDSGSITNKVFVQGLYDDFINQWKTFRTGQLVARNASPG